MLIHTDRRPVAGPRLAGFRFPRDEALLVLGDVHGQARKLREALEGLGRVRIGARLAQLARESRAPARRMGPLGVARAGLPRRRPAQGLRVLAASVTDEGVMLHAADRR